MHLLKERYPGAAVVYETRCDDGHPLTEEYKHRNGKYPQLQRTPILHSVSLT
jgi:hypothetical protein